MDTYFYAVCFENEGKKFCHIHVTEKMAKYDKEGLIKIGCTGVKIKVYKAQLVEEI